MDLFHPKSYPSPVLSRQFEDPFSFYLAIREHFGDGCFRVSWGLWSERSGNPVKHLCCLFLERCQAFDRQRIPPARRPPQEGQQIVLQIEPVSRTQSAKARLDETQHEVDALFI